MLFLHEKGVWRCWLFLIHYELSENQKKRNHLKRLHAAEDKNNLWKVNQSKTGNRRNWPITGLKIVKSSNLRHKASPHHSPAGRFKTLKLFHSILCTLLTALEVINSVGSSCLIYDFPKPKLTFICKVREIDMIQRDTFKDPYCK